MYLFVLSSGRRGVPALSAERQQQKWGIGHSLSSFVIRFEVLKICCLEEVSLQETQEIIQSSNYFLMSNFRQEWPDYYFCYWSRSDPFWLYLTWIWALPADSEASGDDVTTRCSPSQTSAALNLLSASILRRGLTTASFRPEAFQIPSRFAFFTSAINPPKWAALLHAVMLNVGVMWNGGQKCQIAETELWNQQSKQTLEKNVGVI